MSEYIWCERDHNQKAIKVCESCEDRGTCITYQERVMIVDESTEKVAVLLDEKVEEMKNTIFDTYFDLGLVLKQIRDQGLYRDFGYEDLENYAQKRHGFRYRKAAYLIAIVENCEKAELGKEDVRGIEWSKMACLPQLTDENRQEWLEKARELTVEELKREVQKDKKEKKFISFSLSPEQKGLVDRALELAAKLTGSDVKSYHLEVLAQEFVATYGSLDDAAVMRFKDIFGN